MLGGVTGCDVGVTEEENGEDKGEEEKRQVDLVKLDP